MGSRHDLPLLDDRQCAGDDGCEPRMRGLLVDSEQLDCVRVRGFSARGWSRIGCSMKALGDLGVVAVRGEMTKWRYIAAALELSQRQTNTALGTMRRVPMAT